MCRVLASPISSSGRSISSEESLIGVYQERRSLLLGGMRLHWIAGAASLVLLAGCGQAAAAPPSGPTYTDPSAMAAKAKAAGEPLQNCDKPSLDINGALSVVCVLTDINETVWFGTWDSPAVRDRIMKGHEQQGYTGKFYEGNGWMVSAHRQATLDSLVRALT